MMEADANADIDTPEQWQQAEARKIAEIKLEKKKPKK
eukprot:SAG22_NODE_164_length_16817_cov_61.573573_20_plen_37_part_00